MSETQTLAAARAPMVYFIDDSATMREVIKIAFRKENIQVNAFADAFSALEQFESRKSVGARVDLDIFLAKSDLDHLAHGGAIVDEVDHGSARRRECLSFAHVDSFSR